MGVQTTKEHYDSKVYCVDAKLGFDDFASYRNKEVFSWKDPSMEDPREMKAEEVGLNYVGLDGHIGCMVNGAGLWPQWMSSNCMAVSRPIFWMLAEVLMRNRWK